MHYNMRSLESDLHLFLLPRMNGYVHVVGEQLSSTDFNYILCEDCSIPSDKSLIKARKYLDLLL